MIIVSFCLLSNTIKVKKQNKNDCRKRRRCGWKNIIDYLHTWFLMKGFISVTQNNIDQRLMCPEVISSTILVPDNDPYLQWRVLSSTSVYPVSLDSVITVPWVILLKDKEPCVGIVICRQSEPELLSFYTTSTFSSDHN